MDLLFIFTAEYNPPVMEWEHLPAIGPRPEKGFVGLKNAGATCYMNSLLQQVRTLTSEKLTLNVKL